ncbi:hypothetical protein AB0M11_05870 [Streptomyces sp. NPDC051987]|uniref:hypothetical protein n=1 Tax=Streptomyces sp. NPDC051987 TaxID=3155808 RepID=UPI00344A307C
MGSIRVGRAPAPPATPSHRPRNQPGTPGPVNKHKSHHTHRTADARRSTNIHWKRHDVLLDVMPNIPPG